MEPPQASTPPEKQLKNHWAITRTLVPPFIISFACLAASGLNYLFFHAMAEIFSIVVGFTALVVATTAARFARYHFIVFVSIAITWCCRPSTPTMRSAPRPA